MSADSQVREFLPGDIAAVGRAIPFMRWRRPGIEHI